MQNKCKISKCAKYTQGSVDSLANWLIHNNRKRQFLILLNKMQYVKQAKKYQWSKCSKHTQGRADFLANWLTLILQTKEISCQRSSYWIGVYEKYVYEKSTDVLKWDWCYLHFY